MSPFDVRDKRVLVTGGTRGFTLTTVRANLMTPSGPETLAREVSAAGPVDALVHNAATGVHKPLAELGARHLAAVFGVNVAAFLELANRLRPAMPTGGRIVAISSEGARHAVPAYGAVGSSKAALEAVCRQLAVEWAPAISVNVVAPGLLDTHSLAAMDDGAGRRAREIAGSPLGRLVTTDEVAQVVHFLLSAASAGIVGQTLVVDGGRSVRAGL